MKGYLVRRGGGVVAFAVLAMSALIGKSADDPGAAANPIASSPMKDSVELSAAQLGMIDIGKVTEHAFPLEKEAVGGIDFNQDMSAQIFPPYQGRIVQLFVKVGDNVKRGQTLLTIESPDLIQADSALIAAAGVLDLTTRALDRAKKLYELEGIAEKDLQQAISDQQTADGALRAARDGVAVFGKSPSEIDRMVKTRTIDPYLVVPSPITGRVTARFAAPGDFVQPGTAPAPYAVADISRLWMNASVIESDMPLIHNGQQVRVAVMAYPDRVFAGQISTVGATIDPQLHRGVVRADIEDPNHDLLPGMFATFRIVTAAAVNSPALPAEGVVREGDGTMTAWVTTDRHRFTKRIIKIGLQHEGYDQILEGIRSGEQAVTKGAIFLDNLTSGGDS
jgi:membrane fusion protein, heavy metal efflux system